ncbi:MAG: hypothetical protein EOP56_17985 [Sphingobacteriales bacterium]|nr:MAG: hypothetical protein EOP56_17985 [Sphingobacteriales bacterium]
MSKEETLYKETAGSLPEAVESQMFGKPCFKINGKAFVCFFQGCMVFKLTGDIHAIALKLEGAKLFDPSGKGRAMKEWVQVPFAHITEWQKFAEAAYAYTSKST